MAVFNLLLDCENARLSYLMKKSCLCRNLSLNDFWSDNCLTHFEQLKDGLPRYQNKHHQTAKQTKSPCTIQRESKGFWYYWRLPVQLCPSPINPDLHMPTYDPFVLLHEASLWHLPMNASHLSVAKLERKKDKKNTWININYRYKHFGFYQRAIGTQQFTKTSTYL